MWGPSPPLEVCNAGLFIGLETLAADLNSLTAMPLLRRNGFDAAMAVLMVVPIHKKRNPLAGVFFAANGRLG